MTNLYKKLLKSISQILYFTKIKNTTLYKVSPVITITSGKWKRYMITYQCHNCTNKRQIRRDIIYVPKCSCSKYDYDQGQKIKGYKILKVYVDEQKEIKYLLRCLTCGNKIIRTKCRVLRWVNENKCRCKIKNV